jgi:hypothetical protein
MDASPYSRRAERRQAAALTGLGLLLIAASLPAVAIAAAPPSGAHDIAAVFPPWWSHGRAMTAAGIAGEVEASGAVKGVLIVHSDQPGLAARLRDAGALILLDAQGLGGCLAKTPLNGTRP